MKKDIKPLFFTDYESPESFSLSNQFAEHLEFILVKNRDNVVDQDIFQSLSLSIRDRMVRKWLRTQHTLIRKDVKKVYYLSLEFLMGRLLGNALINLDFWDECRDILLRDGYSLEEITELESDMALGNGGLGRLAACFLDSMATLQLPAFGYGIRYEFGIFKQEIVDGRQVEQPDNWLLNGCPWEIYRREIQFRIKFFGKVNSYTDAFGNLKFDWVDTEDVLAVAYDIPVPGYKSNTVNNLRLWQAKASQEFSFNEFNSGNYIAAVESKNLTENISKVLYPNDSYTEGKFLRLKQQYFFVAASLQDIIRKYLLNHSTYDEFSNKVAIQLNDTHPVIAIPELMRLFVDIEGLTWEKAWDLTVNTFAYTNHTVVPEALEEWSVSILEELLPRHLQIIYEINQRFLDFVRENFTNEPAVIQKLSIIREFPEKRIRMANLAIVGSHSVNGVAELHSKIIREILFHEFYKIYPSKFKNVTNGITFRRWIKHANPALCKFIFERIGEGWLKDTSQLKKLEKYANDPVALETWESLRFAAKVQLSKFIKSEYGIKINPDSLFDVQVKRFHEYKRQLLNCLHVINLYNRIKANPAGDFVPRTIIFGGKAAPAYQAAKLIIKLINNVAGIVNNDPDVGNKLKVVFMANYSVTLAEKIIPAADLSEQISTAGLEASGTGNMKFALNGAITIGTMDGANIEILEEVGAENIFIFGLLASEVLELKSAGYNPNSYIAANNDLKKIVNQLKTNVFSQNEPGIFEPLINEITGSDQYLLCADFAAYIKAQDEVSAAFLDRPRWNKMSLLNCARIGKFSSDRSINDYAKNIWNIKPVEIVIDGEKKKSLRKKK